MEATDTENIRKIRAETAVAEIFKDWVEEHAFAEAIGRHICTLRRLCTAGVFVSKKIGRRRYILADRSKEKLLQETEPPPSPLAPARGRGRPKMSA
jgi:hypothetical protein